jgi:hypothetical protein
MLRRNKSVFFRNFPQYFLRENTECREEISAGEGREKRSHAIQAAISVFADVFEHGQLRDEHTRFTVFMLMTLRG